MTLVPDRKFDTYAGLTPAFLAEQGVEALLIAIDNTLAPYEQPLPDEHIKAWVDALKRSGIGATFVSNNGPERVEIFNKDLGLPYYTNCGKPFARKLKWAMRDMGSDKTNTAMLGDQLLTDAAAGKHIGLRAIIVPPIKDKNNAFFRTKRALEVGHIKKYVKLHGEESRVICSFWLDGKYKKKNRS